VLRVTDREQREALAQVFEERAGICQCDGGRSRAGAERIAYRELASTVDQAAKDMADLNGG
jgi:hypothetical protein